MAFVENLDAFFVDFGVAATLNGVAVTVIFDREYIEELGIMGGNNPVALIKSSANPVRNQTLVIGADTYKLLEPKPDGTGLTLMELTK